MYNHVFPLVNINSSESSSISKTTSTSNRNNLLRSCDWTNNSIDNKIDHRNNLSVNSNETKTHNTFQQNLHLQSHQNLQQGGAIRHHRIIDNNNDEVLTKRKRLMKVDIGKKLKKKIII